MNATAVPFPSSFRSDVIRLSRVAWPETATLRVARIEQLPAVAAEPAQPQERHVAAWRASLGHAYAEWADQVPGMK